MAHHSSCAMMDREALDDKENQEPSKEELQKEKNSVCVTFELQTLYWQSWCFIKLDGVGPVDNRPSTD